MSGPDLIADAAAWLRDDPTFQSLDRQAQEREAADVLSQLGGDSDDPLSVALAIEAALAAPAAVAVSGGPAVEPCRENRAGCAAAVSATGRCMDCGAVRKAPEPAPAPQAFTPVVVADEPRALAPRVHRALDSVDTGGGLLYRVKTATGWPDRELAEALGISRATVQAYIGGRLAENLTSDQLRRLAVNLRKRQDALAAVLGDVEGRID